MCASCESEVGLVNYDGRTLCARCGSQREWAPVIAMIQDGLGAVLTGSDDAEAAAVQADPFAAA